MFGFDEYVAIYDYSAVESEEELISSGKDKLKALWKQDKISIDFDESMDTYDVGDVVGAVDNITGLAISATITKKIVTIKNGQITIALSTDEMTSSGANASGNGTASSGGGSGTTWEIGDGLKIVGENTLAVDTVSVVEKDNTRPITSAGVYVEVGNIEAIMKTI